MSNLIQIKRSETTAAPSTLANGELAWSGNSKILYVGANSVVEAIGGRRFPGVLTANHALTANSTSMLDKIMLGNSTVNVVANSTTVYLSNSTQTTHIAIPTSVEQSGQYYLKADGSWSTVTAGSANPAGANTNVQYNDSGVMNGTAAFTYDEVSNNVLVANTLLLGNSTVNATVNGTLLKLSNSTVNTAHPLPTTVEYAGSYFLHANGTWQAVAASPGGANTYIQYNDSGVFNGAPGFTYNETTNNISLANTLFIGNSTVNALANSLLIQVANSTVTANMGPGSFVVGTSTVNATVLAAGANVIIGTVDIKIGNSTVNAFANSLLLQVSNSTVIANQTPGGFFVGTSTINATTIAEGANVLLSTTDLKIGNTTANVFANSILVSIANSTGIANLQPTQLVVGTSTVNTTVLAAGANVIASTVDLKIGNSTVNAFANSLLIQVSNSTVIANHGPGGFAVGTSLVNSTIITTGAGGLVANTIAVAVGANVIASTVDLKIGNSTVNAFANSLLIQVANSTVSANHGPGGFVVGTSSVNSTVITTGAGGLVANTIAVAVGANVIASTVDIKIGNSTVNAFANSLVITVANSTVNANHGPGGFNVGTSVVNATVLAAGANVVMGVADLQIGNSTVNAFANSLLVKVANSTASANHTPAGFFAGTTVVNSTQITVAGGPFMNATTISVTDALISGNLDINGTLTTIDTTNLSVTDSIIQLARANAGATLDIGMYGLYNDGSNRYTGLLWDASAGVYELFANTTIEPGTTVDTAGVGFVRAKLDAYLKTGWGTGVFEANATGVTITANTTWAVALTANTLSLSTALPGTSGGTGRATCTTQDLLVGNTINGFNLLTVGADGKVLQSVSGTLAYADLDGGTFVKDTLFINTMRNEIPLMKGRSIGWQHLDLCISGGIENIKDTI